MPEYLKYRCCMCPQANSLSHICPPSPVLHPEPSPCRFIKSYIDSRGWKYRLMPGISGDTFKARYQKPDKCGSNGWHCVRVLPWRSSIDEAQGDLNAYAESKRWDEAELI